MSKPKDQNKSKNLYGYDDGDIPKVDLPMGKNYNGPDYIPEPLPESSRPRKDGPGGEEGK